MIRFFKLLAACFIGVSCTINFIFGYSASSVPAEAWLLAAISLALDAGKCSLGIAIERTARAKRHAVTIGLSVLLVVCAAYGTLSAWAFAERHGATVAAEYDQPKAQRDALVASLASAKAELAALPITPPDIEQLRAEAASILADTRNNRCAKLDGAKSRGNCPRYFELAPILAAADKREALTVRIESLTTALASAPIPVEVDPRPRIIADLGAQAGLTINGILALSLLTILALELGCIVLPMLAWPPRATEKAQEAPSALPAQPETPKQAPALVEAPQTPKRKRGRPPKPKAPVEGVRVTQRELARQTGKSLAQVNRELKAAAASGEVAVSTGSDGTVIQFMAANLKK